MYYIPLPQRSQLRLFNGRPCSAVTKQPQNAENGEKDFLLLTYAYAHGTMSTVRTEGVLFRETIAG